MWNMPQSQKPTSEADLLQRLADELAARLPMSWGVDLVLQPADGRGRPDALLRLQAPDGTSAKLPIEAKPILNARDVPVVMSQLASAQGGAGEGLGPPVVVSRYLSPRARDALAEAGASYLDATGNLRFSIGRPAVHLEGTGASADPWRGPERQTRTLRGKPAAKVVRALVDFKPPVGIRELANRSGASLGSTYRTVDFLDKEALIGRDEIGTIREVNWRELLLRWSEDYSFQESNRVLAALEPRRLETVVARLRKSPPAAPYAVTGSLSGRRFAEVAPLRLAAILTPQPERLAQELKLRDAVGAPNVLLAQPFDELVFERTTTEDGIAYAALSQSAVDLLTSPGRGPTEGEALLSWMAVNEEAWRG
jgi:hypothetical protein